VARDVRLMVGGIPAPELILSLSKDSPGIPARCPAAPGACACAQWR